MIDQGTGDVADARRGAAALLAWYREMGVDAAVFGDAVDWLAHGDVKPGAAFTLTEAEPRGTPVRPSPLRVTPATPSREPASASRQTPLAIVTGGAPRRVPAAAPDEAVMAARAAARNASSLEELGKLLERFEGCGLRATAKTLCFFRGASSAALMIVGEAPGADEDKAGKPFVGRAGQLLDKMLAAIGLDESSAHITNTVYWRPPGNRTPTPQEAEVCRPFLERQIELVDPKVILMLGGAAAKHLTGVAEGIMRLRGSWREIEVAGRTYRGMATLHPAYLLRSAASKRLAWRDLLAVRAALVPRNVD